MMPRQYDELVKAIIRPPRAEYSVSRLGPRRFTYCSKTFVRTDLVLTNSRGLILRCSHWQPDIVDRVSKQLPCVVFLHGNSSSRLEALSQLPACLGTGLTLFAFDFAGSGKSEGNYVSLGWWEKEDLRLVLDYLAKNEHVSKVAVWGRSMGAVTALLHQIHYDNPIVDALVLDSPFSSFCSLADELVIKGAQDVAVPGFLTNIVLGMLGNSIKSTANFDLKDLVPIDNVHKCTRPPALFVCARFDDFVSPRHVQRLHEKYGGPKEIIFENGDHNTLRSAETLLAAVNFLRRCLCVPQSLALIPSNPKMASIYLSVPWETAAQRARMKSAYAEYNASEVSIRKALYYCNKGNSLEEEGNLDAAIRSYRAAITFCDEYYDAHYNLGIALKQKGEINDAIARYRRTVQLKPDHSDAHNNYGVALEELGDVESAIYEYEQAIRHEPDHAEARCNLADLLQSMSRLEESIFHYRKALAVRPDDSDAQNNLGVALEANGLVDEAVEAYSKAIAIRSGNWDAQANLAEALHAKGDLAEAAGVYRLILERDPTDAHVAASLGNVLHALGRDAEALEAYSNAVANNPGDAVTHNNLGTVLQAMERREEAAEAYKVAIRHDPQYAMAHFNLGVTLQSLGRLNDAISAYNEAIRLRPTYADALNNCGYVLQKKGDYIAAIQAYQRAIDAKPDFENAKANLSQALRAREADLEREREEEGEPSTGEDGRQHKREIDQVGGGPILTPPTSDHRGGRLDRQSLSSVQNLNEAFAAAVEAAAEAESRAAAAAAAAGESTADTPTRSPTFLSSFFARWGGLDYDEEVDVLDRVDDRQLLAVAAAAAATSNRPPPSSACVK